jgi:hypothetical protein
MSLDINLTGVEKTSNKKTNLTDNSDTFYPSQKAVKTAVDAKFNTPTGTTAQYLRGDGSLETFPTIPDVSGLQTKAVVVSANQTAVNDGNYTVVANSTFTDPSPIEGKGYRVFVRNGTATINSVGYTEGTTILRLFHSGAWVSYVSLPDSNFVPTSRTINGLDLSANRTLTASDVGAPSGSGTSTGTNTGDQTLSGLGGVASNAPITPGTYHEVTVDAKGLVTAGSVKWGLLSGNPNTATTGTSGTAKYITFADGSPQNGYTFRQVTFVQATVCKFFAITTITSQPATGSCVFTVQKNGVDTGIVITVASGSASGTFSETSTQVSFSQFDTISVKAVNNASTTSCVIASLSIGIS